MAFIYHNKLYSIPEQKRIRKTKKKDSDYRTEFRRDYARLIHCPSFRRLEGKTQLFPWSEGDFFRNRLTHSIEVAQISKWIAPFRKGKGIYIKKDYEVKHTL